MNSMKTNRDLDFQWQSFFQVKSDHSVPYLQCL